MAFLADSGGDEPRAMADLIRGRWLVFHALALAAIALACLVDEPVFDACNRWYNGPVPINGELHQLILSLAMYGQSLGFVVTILLILIFDRRHRGRALFIGVLIASSGLTSSTLKSIAGRERPLESKGKTVFHGPHKGVTQSRNKAFPSGHASTAFAMSYGLAQCYPPARVLFWSFAGGVAFNRILTVRHFVSDVVAGIWVGLTTAAFMARLRPIRWSVDRTSRIFEPKEGPVPVLFYAAAWREGFRRALASPLLLLVVCLAMYWAGNDRTPLWDRDEPRFATAAREMMQRGDWVVPTFNGELRPDKPILIYWLMGVAYRIFGDGTFAARFFSGVAGAAACLLTLHLGTRLFDRRVGLLAGWMLALSPMLVVESKLATVDALLLLWTTVCFFFLWRLYAGGGAWTAVGFWTALALSILTKGPVALALVALAVAAFSIARREFRWLAGLRPFLGLAVLAAIVLPWVLWVERATGGDFLRIALGHHVVKRSVEPLEGHRGFPGYYLLTLFGLMAPWALLLPFAFTELRSRWRSDPRIAFLTSWALATILLFELVSTKLVHYVLPAYPAMVLLIASALLARFEGRRMGVARLDRRLWRAFAGFAFLVGPVAIGLAVVALPEEWTLAVVLTAVTSAAGSLAGGLLLRERRIKRAFFVLATTGAASILVAGAMLMPAIGRDRLQYQVAQRLAKAADDRGAIALWLFRDPSLVYNLGRVLPVVDPMAEQPMFQEALSLARKRGSFLCPMTSAQRGAMGQDPALELETIETVTHSEPVTGKKREVHLVEVRPSRRIAQIERVRSELKGLAPGRASIKVPLDSHSPAESANAGRRYPLNPVFLSGETRSLK